MRPGHGQATAPGSKEIPEGKENCFAGLTFVITGDLSSLSRDDAQDLIKRYGGRCTSAVSGKTDYLIVGSDPGQTKIKQAEKNKTPQINEDQLFQLLATSEGKSDEQVQATKTKHQLELESKAATIDMAQVQAAGATQLWVDKYKPTQPSEILGNRGNVEKLTQWLRDFEQSRKNKFRFTGERNTTHFKAALLSGAPGVGKTTAAHVVARSLGYEIMEFNASDLRTKRSLDNLVAQIMTNTSIQAAFQPRAAAARHVLIMDEIDGMSSSDRGGVAELTALIKKTKIPVICLCNDRTSPKLRTLAGLCLDLRFRRPEAQHVRARLMRIAYLEKMQIPGPALDALYAATNGDIRQTIHLMSTYRLSHDKMDFEAAKKLGSDSEKDLTVGIFDATRQMLSHEFRRQTLAQQLENFYHDYEMVPLMVQENYVKVRCSADPVECMEGLSRAAESIAEGNVLERAIRTDQKWGLLNAYGVASTVAPAAALASYNGGGGASGMYQFTSVLGNLSKANKGFRQLESIELRIARGSHIGAGRLATRLDYVPVLALLIARGVDEERCSDVVTLMDGYFLAREDLDDLFELGVGETEHLFKHIPSAAKSKFTREYNRLSHPVALVTLPTKRSRSDGAAMEEGEGDGLHNPDEVEGSQPLDDEEEADDVEAIRKALAKTAGSSTKGKRGAAKKK